MLAAGSGTGSGTVNGHVLWAFDQARCMKGLARMVISHEYPFNCVNHHFLKVFLHELQPAFIIPSRYTLRKDYIKVYEEEHYILYDLLGKLDCKFSFTSDLWTCKGKDRSFMILTCHFIDDKWKMRKRILNFKSLSSPHTGRNISQSIYEKLVLWNLDKRVFSLVVDNASSNDACIKDLLSRSSFKKGLLVGGNIFHQRCGCHILNLIVHDGLSVLITEIKNVRETMKYLRHSQSRMEKFCLAVAQVEGPTNKKPAWDVPTRWNSTYKMLDLTLSFREAINRYATMDLTYTHCPTELEWDNVNSLVGHLKVLYDATNKLGGSKYPTLNLFFPEFCEVYLNIKKMQESTNEFVVEMRKEMLIKWEKYWSIGNCLLAMACVLDPRCKMAIVEYYYGEIYPEATASFLDNLKVCLDALFKEYSKEHSNSPQSQAGNASSSRSRSSASSIVSNTRAGLKDYLSQRKNTEPIKSELEVYLVEPLDLAGMDDDFDILSWWRLKAPKYPILAKLTRDVLVVPISTVASEATFSTTGRTLSPIRSSLNDESIESLICAQDWLRASVTENGGVFGDVIWSSDEAATPDDTICS